MPMKIEDFDLTKAKNRKRIRQEKRKCEIEISHFPTSSNVEEIILTCDRFEENQEVTPENTGYNILQSMRTLGLIDSQNKKMSLLKNISKQKDLNLKKAELAIIVSRSNWMKSWMNYSGKKSIFEMQYSKSMDFVKHSTHGKESTIKSRS